MRLEVSEGVATSVVSAFMGLASSASKLMMAAAEKLSWESEYMEKKMPLTDEEVKRDLSISNLELNNRERKAKVESLELDAREARAMADRAEAQLKQRTVNIRAANLNRSTHKPKGGQAPSKAQPVGTERRSSVEGKNSSEGKSLTYTLGDKSKESSAAPS